MIKQKLSITITEMISITRISLITTLRIIRPPDSLLLSIFIFIRQLLTEVAERNSANTGHMLESQCDLIMYI